MNPHLLYIAFWFPPSRASGVYRALATARAFVEAGWDVTVMTTTERFLEDEIGSVDTSLIEEIPDEVTVLRVPFTFDQSGLESDVRKMSWFRGNFPLIWFFLFRRTRRIRKSLDILRGRAPAAFGITENYVTWIEPTVRQAQRVSNDRRIDHILATGNPFSSFEVARVVSNLCGAPFSIDYRDPWTIDVFTETDADLPEPTVAAERQIVEEATWCIQVNQAIADAYKAKYPDQAAKQIVVLNGYDPESIGPQREALPSGPIRFGMIGTVNDRWPLEAIFDGWLAARPELPEGSKLVLAGHLGYFARSEAALRPLLLDEYFGFEYIGPVTKADVAKFYAGLDVVVVPAPGGAMVTSGKVFEAAALGIPVVCVQSLPGGARRILEDHPSSFGAEPDAASVCRALIAAASSARTLTLSDMEKARASMTKYRRDVTIRALVDAINRTTIAATRQ